MKWRVRWFLQGMGSVIGSPPTPKDVMRDVDQCVKEILEKEQNMKTKCWKRLWIAFWNFLNLSKDLKEIEAIVARSKVLHAEAMQHIADIGKLIEAGATPEEVEVAYEKFEAIKAAHEREVTQLSEAFLARRRLGGAR